MNIHKITYPTYLSRARETRTLRIDLNHVMAITGIHTSWRPVNSGCQYYSSFTIYTDIAERSFEIQVNDATTYSAEQKEKHQCADEPFIPGCETFVAALLAEIDAKWGK